VNAAWFLVRYFNDDGRFSCREHFNDMLTGCHNMSSAAYPSEQMTPESLCVEKLGDGVGSQLLPRPMRSSRGTGPCSGWIVGKPELGTAAKPSSLKFPASASFSAVNDSECPKVSVADDFRFVFAYAWVEGMGWG
jgi:hypothetical protein